MVHDVQFHEISFLSVHRALDFTQFSRPTFSSIIVITIFILFFFRLPGHLSIQVGSIELHFGGPPYGISLAIYHPKYDPNVIQNDIALIKTTTPIQFNNNTQPIPLNEDNIPAGETLTLSGWGRTGLPGEISEFLQYIDLKSISNNDCKMSMSDVTNLQLCTFTKKGEGACRGDSGGPLVYKGKIAGIVSYGKPCAAGFPDVFTRISKYVDWIQGVIKYN